MGSEAFNRTCRVVPAACGDCSALWGILSYMRGGPRRACSAGGDGEVGQRRPPRSWRTGESPYSPPGLDNAQPQQFMHYGEVFFRPHHVGVHRVRGGRGSPCIPLRAWIMRTPSNSCISGGFSFRCQCAGWRWLCKLGVVAAPPPPPCRVELLPPWGLQGSAGESRGPETRAGPGPASGGARSRVSPRKG